MAYSVPSEITRVVPVDKLKTVLGLGDDAGELPDAKVQEFIDDADLNIDTALGSIYQIPITGTASLRIVKSISIGLAIGAMFAKFLDGKVPERWKEIADKAEKRLNEYSGDSEDGIVKSLPDAPTNFSYAVTASEKVVWE